MKRQGQDDATSQPSKGVRLGASRLTDISSPSVYVFLQHIFFFPWFANKCVHLHLHLLSSNPSTIALVLYASPHEMLPQNINMLPAIILLLSLFSQTYGGEFMAWNNAQCHLDNTFFSQALAVVATQSQSCTPFRYEAAGGILLAYGVSSTWNDDPKCTFSLYTDTSCSPTSLAHTIESDSGTCRCLTFPKPMKAFSVFCNPVSSQDRYWRSYNSLVKENNDVSSWLDGTSLEERAGGSCRENPPVARLSLLAGLVMQLALELYSRNPFGTPNLRSGDVNFRIENVRPEEDAPGFVYRDSNAARDAVTVGRGFMRRLRGLSADQLAGTVYGTEFHGFDQVDFYLGVETLSTVPNGVYTLGEFANDMTTGGMQLLVRQSLAEMRNLNHAVLYFTIQFSTNNLVDREVHVTFFKIDSPR